MSQEVRQYIVQAGDSPASIAANNDPPSCPKCAIDLVRANPHKATVTYPNGFTTFKELRLGETIRLPNKWFEPRFELLPPAYFGSLPYSDGVTPSPFGHLAFDILSNFRALDQAADRLGALKEMDDNAFVKNVGDVAQLISVAAQPALGVSRFADAAQQDVQSAIPHSRMFSTFHAAGLPSARSRADVERTLVSALYNAQLALQEMYSTIQPPVKK
jgi:hypothetical protein